MLGQSRHQENGQSPRVGRGQVTEGFTKCGLRVGFYSKCNGEVLSKGVTGPDCILKAGSGGSSSPPLGGWGTGRHQAVGPTSSGTVLWLSVSIFTDRWEEVSEDKLLLEVPLSVEEAGAQVLFSVLGSW